MRCAPTSRPAATCCRWASARCCAPSRSPVAWPRLPPPRLAPTRSERVPGRSLAVYQVADVVSKFIAVLLLPVYTRYINPSGYGVVELLANGVIFVSILVRFGMIEAFLRFYFTDADQARRDALARRAVRFL